MPKEFTRLPSGFEFIFGGMKANERPDSLPPTKYTAAQNIRSYSQNQVRTRPGVVPLFAAGLGTSAVDLRAYTTLQTDDLPRILLRDNIDGIWLDNGVQVGTLAGGGSTFGVSMIPFRPNRSPQPWMYIANGNDYQKFSSPTAANAVTAQKAGIAEPQAGAEAYPTFEGQSSAQTIYQNHATTPLVPGGTAGATSSGSRVSDTVLASFNDPARALDPGNIFQGNNSLQVASSVAYTPGMLIKVGTGFQLVVDVFSTIATGLPITGIYYFTGTTGHCLITPASLSTRPTVEQSIYTQSAFASLRRGALIKIGSEVCVVWSVTIGPDNSITIETSTTGTHTTGDAFSTVPTIVIANQDGNLTGQSITCPDDTFQVTAGIGTVSLVLASNPFYGSGPSLYQDEDYLHLSVLVDNLANLVEAKLLVDIGDGSFTQNFLYFTIRPADITAAVLNTATQLAAVQTTAQNAIIDELNAIATDDQNLQTWAGEQTPAGASQWAEIKISLSELTRVGSDVTKSLTTATKIQVLFNASGTINCAVCGLYTTGGFQPDVGDVGEPYSYRYRGRSSITGAVSNPSPRMRYGVNPRREAVVVVIPNGATPYDPQIDTWDVYRFGGSVTEWRFIGSVLSSALGPTSPTFIDNYGDDAATAGDALDFDNFEPWPSIDLPFIGPPVAGGTGTAFLVNGASAPNILRFLPGTLVQFSFGSNAYTLRKRPVLISGTTYRIELEETAVASGSVIINEPYLANQNLPYMWGPDVNGTVFACGDTLRPGTLYFSKSNAPDAAPDTYNIEITPPSEPLLGGEIVDGLSFVASSKRWWALYPQLDNPLQRFNFVEQPFTRGLAAPFGHCTDGKKVFYWAKDGIYANDESLTDADLYNVFPHEGVVGSRMTYNGVGILPPDYAQAPKFRLAYANGYLYATYPYIGGNGLYAPVLVCDLRTRAWSQDLYNNMYYMTNVYQIEQTPYSRGALNPVVLFVGAQLAIGNAALVLVQTELANDNGGPIFCSVGTFEFDAGDKRAPKQWGDVFVDCRPASPTGITVTPMSLGASVAAPTTIPTNAARVRIPISVGGIVVSDFLGAFFQWTDDFTRQTTSTHLYLWQPSFNVQPATDISWTSFGSAFDGKGYQHLRQLTLAWVSQAPITISTQAFDGLDPVPIVIPSSGGAYQKAVFPFSANKGLLFSFTASSPLPFQIFNDDSELYVGEWGRQDGYKVFRGFGGRTVDDAPI